MPLGNFPQLQGLLQKRQNPQQQVMPQMGGTQFVQAGQSPATQQPTQYAQPQGQVGSYTQPVQGGTNNGQLGQQLFNKQQQDANKGLAGGQFNRRRF